MNMKSFGFTRLILFIPAILAFAMYFIPNNFELFPRVGWVDAGMYAGYANNENLIKDYGFTIHNYQGSRLGYIVPAKIFSKTFGPLSGRYLFVLFFYLTSLLALISILRKFIKRTDVQSLFLTVIVCNPILLAGISYGGADGPSATYSLLFAAFLYRSATIHIKNTDVFLVVAGIFAALGFSTHVLSIVPLSFIAATYFFWQTSNLKSKIITLSSAFLVTIICLYFIGHYFGIERNYLIYSFSWGVQSIKGLGGNFVQPLREVLMYSLVYLPPLVLFFLSIKLFSPVSTFKQKFKDWNIPASIFLSAGPLLFFLLYDKVLNGSISQYLPYYVLLYPCFVLSFLFLLMDKSISFTKNFIIITNITLVILFILSIYNTKLLYSLLLIAAVIALIYSLSKINNHNSNSKPWVTCFLFALLAGQQLLYLNNTSLKPFFHLIGSANSEELYKSQLKFMNTITKLPRAYGLPHFVYESSKNENGLTRGQFYHTYFNGHKNIYAHLDSLTSLFLWDRSNLSTHPFAPEFKSEFETSDHSRQLVILGRNNDEVDNIFHEILSIAPDMQTITKECYPSEYYPWCIQVVREFTNKGQE